MFDIYDTINKRVMFRLTKFDMINKQVDPNTTYFHKLRSLLKVDIYIDKFHKYILQIPQNLISQNI